MASVTCYGEGGMLVEIGNRACCKLPSESKSRGESWLPTREPRSAGCDRVHTQPLNRTACTQRRPLSHTRANASERRRVLLRRTNALGRLFQEVLQPRWTSGLDKGDDLSKTSRQERLVEKYPTWIMPSETVRDLRGLSRGSRSRKPRAFYPRYDLDTLKGPL